jgi:hypothetical protein
MLADTLVDSTIGKHEDIPAERTSNSIAFTTCTAAHATMVGTLHIATMVERLSHPQDDDDVGSCGKENKTNVMRWIEIDNLFTRQEVIKDEATFVARSKIVPIAA